MVFGVLWVGTVPVAPAAELAVPDGSLTQAWQRVGPVEVLAPEPAGTRSEALLLDLRFLGVGVPPEGDSPTELAFSPDGTLIVVAHRDSQNLVVFNAATRAVLRTVALSGSPNSLAFCADGVHVVTANVFEDTVSIADVLTGVEVAVVPVGDQPGIVRVTPDGTLAIVGNTLTSDLSVVDIAGAVELRRLAPVGFVQITSFGTWAVTYRFTDFEITPDNATVIFPDKFNNRLQFFTIASGAVTSLTTQTGPYGIDLSPDGSVAVVSHDYPNSLVSVIDVPGRAVTKTIPTGGTATSVPPIAMNPSKTKAVVTVQNGVRVVNLTTNAVSATLSTGAVNFEATTADGLYCVVGGYLGSIVSFAGETIVCNPLNSTTPDALAVSPVNARAATAHILRKESMEVINTNGAAGYLEGTVPTGPPPEGDKARNVAVGSDGLRAVVINNHSQNATVFDLQTDSILHVVTVGERPGDVALTPDNNRAVVANLDSAFASVIDLTTGLATHINISRRAGQVAVAPNGQYAYFAVVADGDGVWRINLNTLQVEGARVLTGDMGGIGFVFDQASGMTLSHDGATLVTCNSFTNNLSIINTATWSEALRLTVGTFPVRAVFSPDDSRIYVTNKNSNTVSVVANAGPSSYVITTINVGSQPWEMAVSPDGSRLYVGNFDARSISVINTSTYAVVNTIPIPQTAGAGQPVGLAMSADGTELYVAANGADFHVMDTTLAQIVATINTGLAPADLAFNEATRSALIPSPYGADGLSIVTLFPPGDFDADGDVDLLDVAVFQNCYTGSSGGPVASGCRAGDLDGDGGITLEDYTDFEVLLTGP